MVCNKGGFYFMKGSFKHISFDQRKVISSLIKQNKKLKDIGLALNLDPTSISKEAKRNRTRLYPVHNPNLNLKKCLKLDRFPFVCDNCKHRYNPCLFEKYIYDVSKANTKAQSRLILSRRGLDINDDEFKKIDKAVKEGIENNESIYHIVKANNLSKSITTIYRYINSGYLTTKRIDLPLAITYKKRKKYKKKYDYDTNKHIDRSNHTYLDYLSYIHTHPNSFGWQLDLLGSIKTDSKSILSLVMINIHFPLIDIITSPTSDKIVQYFDDIEDEIGIIEFKKIFPYILTDRDPVFSNIKGICYSKVTGELRTELFYCDPYVSNQKPQIENLNKQLRLHFPKGKSIDKLTKKEVKLINKILIDKKLKSLDGYAPKEVFEKLFSSDTLNKLIK
jgi:Transposase and inactivated derivatives, IS30 family